MSASPETTLTSLLPSSPYLLAYALPLLCFSLVLTFAGAFFTLDRTRAFAPRYDALHPTDTTTIQHAEVMAKRIFRLEGGIGGIAIGYATGIHFTTFLSLLIPNVSSNPSLSASAFVAVWLLPTIVCAILAARWKYVALGFAGLVGYSTLALAFAVIVHPSLLTRHILIAVFTPIGLIMCLLPIARTQHVFVRVGMASVGSFGTVVSIALLARLPAWSDVWDRLWIHDGSDWGTAKEKGLSAAFCLFLLVGIASDWFLKLKLGENPDQKWDSYLAEYAATLPNAADRAGTFRPIQSFWSRHFGHRDADPIDKDILFPADADLKLPVPDSPLKLYKKKSLGGSHSPQRSVRRFTPPQELLRKERRPVLGGRGRAREIIKFDPNDPYILTDSDDEDDLKKTMPAYVRSPIRMDSMATLTDERPSPAEGAPAKGGRVTMDTLSDDEEDVTSSVARDRTGSPHGTNWTPDFIRRHSQRQLAHKQSSADFSQAASSSNDTGSSNTLTPTVFAPVAATPSLIRAVERVNAAQQEAFASRSTDGLPIIPTAAIPGEPHEETPTHAQSYHWDSFWRDVKTKAGHGFHHAGGSGPGSKR
ncbi:hypothetical protein BD413DRAFT_665887 [Trametes elegans]|nr:hypothetical protein BD413DRAFT_665887 [Trametes elegans]